MAKRRGSTTMDVSDHDKRLLILKCSGLASLQSQKEMHSSIHYHKLGDKLAITPNFHLEKIKLQETPN